MILGAFVNVCPSAWKNSASDGRIFVKFDFLKISLKIQIALKSDKINGYFA